MIISRYVGGTAPVLHIKCQLLVKYWVLLSLWKQLCVFCVPDVIRVVLSSWVIAIFVPLFQFSSMVFFAMVRSTGKKGLSCVGHTWREMCSWPQTKWLHVWVREISDYSDMHMLVSEKPLWGSCGWWAVFYAVICTVSFSFRDACHGEDIMQSYSLYMYISALSVHITKISGLE